ncbi:MAG: PhoU domain-containing protein [Pseudonocardiaceae bacterium]
MADVAAKAGVSRALVSLVFREAPGASEQTRERVFEACYAEADSLGYDIVLSTTVCRRGTRSEPSTPCSTIGVRRSSCSAPKTSQEYLTQLSEAHPVVTVSRKVPQAPLDVVHTAEGKGVRQAIAYLVEQGHHAVVRIDGGSGPGSADRRRAYPAAMRKLGLCRAYCSTTAPGPSLPGIGSSLEGMREFFHGELATLGRELAEMCAAATTAMRQATEALLWMDLALAEQVMSADARLDAARDRCEEHAYRMLALQAPVAGDLRSILAAIYCADKIERMGDLAAHIAEVAHRNHPDPAFPAEMGGVFAELGRLDEDIAIQLEETITAPTGTGFAALDRADADIDILHDQLLEQATDDGWPHGIRTAINVALLARFYERFADQAVSTARRMDFAATGVLPR